MTIRVTRFPNGPWRQNCYIVGAENSQSILIDPGSDSESIKAEITRLGLSPLAIINTHAHFDHIGAVLDLMEYYEVPFYLHDEDAALLRRANLYRLVFDGKTNIRTPDGFTSLAESEFLTVGPFEITVLRTPGHTPGGVSFRLEDNLFTGDTLLSNGPGRHDLPGGNETDLADSIALYRSLPPHLKVYAGHGRPFNLEDGLQAGNTASTPAGAEQ